MPMVTEQDSVLVGMQELLTNSLLEVSSWVEVIGVGMLTLMEVKESLAARIGLAL